MSRSFENNVVHVLFAPVIGGCESLCYDLVERWHCEGRSQSVVFLSTQSGPLIERLSTLHRIPTYVCEFERTRRFDFIKRFAALCRSHRFETVIIYCFGLHLFIALGARLGGARKVFVSMQNPPPQHHRRRITTALLAQCARPWVDKEWVCSRYVAQQARRLYRLPARRLELIPNWCNVDGIARRAQAARQTRNNDGPIITMVARMDGIKNHRMVVAAFAEFHRRWPAARLRLIGDGPERAALEGQTMDLGITPQVDFLGSRSDVPEQLGQSDLFVYATTAEEGFGIVMAEAMAAGLAVVATDVGPCAEVLDHGRAGVLVQPGSATALANAMHDLWTAPAKRQALIQAAAHLAQTRYSLTAATQQIGELLAR